MTDQQILQRAIELAIERGWQQRFVPVHGNTKDKNKAFVDLLSYSGYGIDWGYDDGVDTATLIYNHEFAKALWGERKEVPRDNSDYTVSAHSGEFKVYENAEDWQYHLQQMVISPDPIKYLGENI